MTDCLFCKIVNNEIPSTKVYEDEDVLVFKDIYPSAPVHLLMVPKKHISSLFELGPEDGELMGKMMLKVPEVAKANGLEKGFKTQINTGKAGGQEVFHIHIHIMGRP